MKRLVSLVMVITFSLAFLTGCTGGSSNEIKIGINYELSGEVATYG